MLKSLNISVFDGFFVAFLIVGILRGRKRGISEELLDVLQWIAIVVCAAFAYPAIGGLLINFAAFPPVLGNVFGYVLTTLIVVFLFRILKRGVGEKLVQGDVFGRF